ncbi:hypothetical protein BKA69DRAFT_934299 [Paraphysoderma sedebokerense]|nr:hypothetical protein BKA69DRAFT_934299 [Paraphysoderma sedebokerense]
MASCNLLPNLPSPQVYNVSIFVAGQYSNADMQIRYGNFPPVANPTNATVSEDTMSQLVLYGSDPDGDQIEVILTALPINGKLYQYDPSKPNALGFEADLGGIIQGRVIDSMGRIVYVPNANYFGVDSLSFKVTDLIYNVITSSAEVIVPITINPVPEPPMVSIVQITGQEDTVFTFTIAIADVDTPLSNISVVIDTVPSNGNIEYILNSAASVYILTAPSTIPPGYHSLKYTPNPNCAGQDQFTYHANDGLNNSNVVTATIFVTPVNDKPVALSDAVSTMEDQGCIIRFAVDDVDQPVSIRQRVKILSWDDTLGNLYQVNLDGVKYGSPVGPNTEITDDNNRLWFEPKPDQSGTARVNFTATDNSNAISDPASIDITVTPVNDAPQIVKCAEEILLTSPIRNGFSVIPVTLRVKDADSNENLSFQLVEAPQKGKLLLDGKDVGVGVRYFVGSSVQPNSEVIIILNYQLLFQGGG